MSILSTKKIILGVSTSVSLYKSLDLIRVLRKQNIEVHVVLTENASKMISKNLFEVLSNNFVHIDGQIDYSKLSHIELARKADAIIICPATANIIGKIANGIADTFLTTLVLAANCPKLICPAMNSQMWLNSIVQENVEKLKRHGFKFVEPKEGILACGIQGVGKLASINEIMFNLEKLFIKQDLKGKDVLITTGATIEKIDPVRFISNFSSGKMGKSLALEALKRGARVKLICGENVEIEELKDLDFGIVKVQSALEMKDAVLKNIGNCDYFISAAAISDFKPKRFENNKIKKKDILNLELEKNVDILESIKNMKFKKKPMIVGFALETEDLKKNALLNLKEKNLDLIIANSIENLGSEEKEVVILDGKREVRIGRSARGDVARLIWDKVITNFL